MLQTSGMDNGIWLVTSAQGAGKSTVADLLARSFERGVHVRGGLFYRWAVRGWVHFDDADPKEARRLLELRYRLSSRVAEEYATAGFTCIVQDNIYGDDVTKWLASIRRRPLFLVVLRPTVGVLTARDQTRRRSTGKTSYRGSYTPAQNDADLATTPRHLGLWLDTSDQTPEQTVAEVLSRRREAMVP